MKGVMTTALTLLTATPAAADFFIEWPQGRYIYVPYEVILTVGVLLGAIFIVGLASDLSKTKSSTQLEIEQIEQIGYYQGEADKIHALKRKLDAETALADSYINAKRKQAELEDLSQIIGQQDAKRRR